jgi:hypothetical protein
VHWERCVTVPRSRLFAITRVSNGFEIYAGPGTGYAIILKEHDAAVRQLTCTTTWGVVLQAGAERRFPAGWGLFADFKYVWLDVDADVFLPEASPSPRVRLDPVLVSVGVTFRLLSGSPTSCPTTFANLQREFASPTVVFANQRRGARPRRRLRSR